MTETNHSVFISSPASARLRALAIYQYLRRQGCDVFLDLEPPRKMQDNMLAEANIRARSHFLLLLTPSFHQQGERLLLETEIAIDSGRNLVPLLFDGFSFDGAHSERAQTIMRALQQYSPLRLPADYFYAAMERLELKILVDPPATHNTPLTEEQQQATREGQRKTEDAPLVGTQELGAEEWLEQGSQRDKGADDRMAWLTHAIQLKPDLAEAYLQRGDLRLGEGNAEAAIEDLDQALRLNPRMAAAYHTRGLAYRAAGDFDKALTDFNQTVKLNPGLAKAYYNRANTLRDCDDYAGAISDYGRTLKLRPNYAKAYNNRGTAFRALGKLDAAMADYNRALELDPEYVTAYHNRANCRRFLADFDGAIGDYERYLALGGGQRHGDEEEVQRLIYDLLRTTTPTKGSVSSPQPKVGRLDPCPCGSQKRYKDCCGRLA